MKRGYFITFEGIEGCGKTTQLELAADILKGKGLPVTSTREPGGTEIGIQIRKILLSEKSKGLLPVSESLLYLADRYQHLQEFILPALESGRLVLCDRYHDSTVAYQGYARGISMEVLNIIWSAFGSLFLPDLTILLDLEPQSGLRRSLQKLEQQGVDESRFETEALEFHRKVRDGFLQIAQESPDRVRIVDASGGVEEVREQVMVVLEGWLRAREEI